MRNRSLVMGPKMMKKIREYSIYNTCKRMLKFGISKGREEKKRKQNETERREMAVERHHENDRTMMARIIEFTCPESSVRMALYACRSRPNGQCRLHSKRIIFL